MMQLGLDEIHAANKALSVAGQWVEAANQRLYFVVPLEIDEATLEGLVLRGRAVKDRPDEEVMFQLEFPQPSRRDRGIDRIDWRPLHTHNNLGRGPDELRFMPQVNSHHHAFDLNWLAAEARMLTSNLPLARPIEPDLKSFDDLLAFIKKSFRINDIGQIPPPPWEGLLL